MVRSCTHTGTKATVHCMVGRQDLEDGYATLQTEHELHKYNKLCLEPCTRLTPYSEPAMPSPAPTPVQGPLTQPDPPVCGLSGLMQPQQRHHQGPKRSH